MKVTERKEEGVRKTVLRGGFQIREIESLVTNLPEKKIGVSAACCVRRYGVA